jgi:hypothetical protein
LRRADAGRRAEIAAGYDRGLRQRAAGEQRRGEPNQDAFHGFTSRFHCRKVNAKRWQGVSIQRVRKGSAVRCTAREQNVGA